MFKSLCIENFQSHKKTVLNFDAGVKVIIGRSDSGKSAIIRAIRWLVENKPNGNSFINYDESKASVEIDIGDTILKRGKDK